MTKLNISVLAMMYRSLNLQVLLWTRIFHVCPHSISETRFSICEKLILEKVEVATYFIFILKGK